MRRGWIGLLWVAALGCVPNGPVTTDGGTGSATKPRPPAVRPPSPPPHPTAAVSAPPNSASAPLGPRFEDAFERGTLGDAWRTTSPVWRVEAGRLCGRGARNHPVWLARTLPANVRIEFDAVSQSPDGDIKAEFFGDGASAATAVSYTNATSYLTILGGWKNSYHVLARIDEHAPDRNEIRIVPSAQERRERPVVPDQVYHFRVERADGRTISWWVDDVLMFRFADPQPLAGPGHDHFGFNDWDVPVCFDNVKVVPL
jgi:hypothetical protein